MGKRLPPERPPARLGADSIAKLREDIRSEVERRLFEHVDALEAEIVVAMERGDVCASVMLRVSQIFNSWSRGEQPSREALDAIGKVLGTPF